jgi:carboxyl-terminal processing protease
VVPPAFQAPPSAPAEGGQSQAQAQTSARRHDILEAAWTLVRDKHYDKTLGGLDWAAVRARYEPRALAAPTEAAFYRILNDMLGELGQSHMLVVGPGSEDELPEGELVGGALPAETATAVTGAAGQGGAGGAGATPARSPTASAPNAAPSSDFLGDPGLTVRSIENKPVITTVRAGSSAARAGLRPGYVVTAIGGHPLGDAAKSRRPLRPAEERFAVRRAAAHRLQGAPGTKVTVRYLDFEDRPGEVLLERERPAGTPVQIGYLPPIYPETQARLMGDVGVVRFNFFLLAPVLADVKKAIDRFRTSGAKAIILDLRGNPGGQGAMSIPVAAAFVKEPLTLGTIQFRDFSQTLTARPSLDVTPFLGPLVLLTDEGSASTSEMLAGGLQEARRAVVVGETTLGAVLPSLLESLPHGAVMQYVVADFRTPKGVFLEDRGVRPDRIVMETRTAFRDGRDPILEAGLDVAHQLIRQKKTKP